MPSHITKMVLDGFQHAVHTGGPGVTLQEYQQLRNLVRPGAISPQQAREVSRDLAAMGLGWMAQWLGLPRG